MLEVNRNQGIWISGSARPWKNLSMCGTKKLAKSQKCILPEHKKEPMWWGYVQAASKEARLLLPGNWELSCDCEPGAHAGITKRPNPFLFLFTNMRLQKQKCDKETSLVSSVFRAGLIQHQPDYVALWFIVLVWSCSLWFILTARDFLHLILLLISFLS